MAPFVKDLNTPLLELFPGCNFTLSDACTGVHIFGGIGSGKTSGSGKLLAGAYLRAGMGGVVTCVKPGEVELWRKYAAEHGRSRSLILFDENEGFNFLAYELGRHGMQGIGTVVESFMRILEAAKRSSATASQRGGEAFWEDASRQVLRYTVPPIYSAQGSASIPDIVRFISSAPTSQEQLTNREWQRRSFMYSIMDAAASQPKIPMEKAALQENIAYWSEQFPCIPEKTRGNIIITLTTVLDRFKHGRLQQAFCGRTSIVPEMTFHGAIILLAMPTLVWNEDGVIAQQLFKFLWQRAVLNRNSLEPKHRERPVFLWSDEAQETVSAYDGEFLGMARDSKSCVTYLSQSLPTYVAKIGGDNPRDAAEGLVGKFKNHIYHANSCPTTNEYASRVIGKIMKRRGNYSSGSSQGVNVGMNTGSGTNHSTSRNSGSSYSSGGTQSSSGSNSGSGSSSGTSSNWGENRGQNYSRNESRGYSESMENAVEPGDFARLKTGGAQNNYEVTGVWYQSGRVFRCSGTNMFVETFKQ